MGYCEKKDISFRKCTDKFSVTSVCLYKILLICIFLPQLKKYILTKFLPSKLKYVILGLKR